MIEPRLHISTENFLKFGLMVFEIYVRTHRQTDIRTLIAVLRIAIGLKTCTEKTNYAPSE